VYEKEQKGPVTAIADINGLLITAIGQKVQMLFTVKGEIFTLVLFLLSVRLD
jgi:hypothetical protein